MSPVITVFGSSRPRRGEAAYERAFDLGRRLAGAGFTVCNGGYAGIMAASARGAKEAGGRTIGVTTAQFRSRRNAWIDRERRMRTWHERLFELIRLGDGYVVLGGGTGTLVEMACVWEMMRKGLMPLKPVVVVGPFWKSLIRRIRRSPDVGEDIELLFAGNPIKAAGLLQRHFRTRA